MSASVMSAVSSGAHCVNSAATLGRRSGWAGEVEAGDPVLWLGERDVRVQDAAGLAVREDPLARRDCHQGAGANCFGRRGVALVGVVEVGLDERDADILGLGVGQ